MASAGSARPGGLGPPGRWVAGLLLVAVTAGVLAVLLWPSGTDIRHVQMDTWRWVWTRTGRQTWFTPDLWSGFVNAAIFLVPACAITLLTRTRWWLVALGGVLVSGAVEAYQAVELAGARMASLGDVLINSFGALVGALVGAGVRRGRPGGDQLSSPS